MKLTECVSLLNAQVFVPAKDQDMDIQVACGADLMSDVMAFACFKNEMMLTGLVNTQTIRTAEMMDVKVVVFVRGKQPNEQMMALGRDKEICILGTDLPMFTACGLLYEAGIRGKGE